jgi:hypothetical protein
LKSFISKKTKKPQNVLTPPPADADPTETVPTKKKARLHQFKQTETVTVQTKTDDQTERELNAYLYSPSLEKTNPILFWKQSNSVVQGVASPVFFPLQQVLEP